MQNFDLKLTLNEINVIMQALGNAPYATVADLVANIRAQVQIQIDAANKQDKPESSE